MNEKTIITIGIPVYNGERVIEDRIKQILGQTFKNFIIIISDNHSTDKTKEKCEKLSREDNRIIYFCQEMNRGPDWNTNFVLSKAKTKYFVWAFADDIWSENFLEKNINVLENNNKVVGSIGELKLFHRISKIENEKSEIKILENSKKYQYVHPVSGKLDDKIKFYLNYSMSAIMYAVFRTDKLQKSAAITFEQSKDHKMWRMDFACILSIIKEGDLEVISDAFVYKEINPKSKSVIQYMKKSGYNSLDIIFYNFPFTIWCAKNLGSRIFLKNFGYFIKLNIISGGGLIAEILRMCKRILSGKERYW